MALPHGDVAGRLRASLCEGRPFVWFESLTTNGGVTRNKEGSRPRDHRMRCRYDVNVRTTLNIDDDVLAVARVLARRNGISLGLALSELARRGFKSAPTADDRGDGTLFAVAADAKPITSEDVYRALRDLPLGSARCVILV